MECFKRWIFDLIKNDHAKIFLQCKDKRVIGFAQCQLRFDYVEGTESSLVGYLESIFIKKENRKHGCARVLLAACETWAFSMGCKEFVSDCELDNDLSLQFHLQTRFTEVNRIICFKKFL